MQLITPSLRRGSLRCSFFGLAIPLPIHLQLLPPQTNPVELAELAEACFPQKRYLRGVRWKLLRKAGHRRNGLSYALALVAILWQELSGYHYQAVPVRGWLMASKDDFETTSDSGLLVIQPVHSMPLQIE